jgi:hypothetical protein
MTETAIDRFCAAIVAANMAAVDVFCEDVALDATVPNWHFVRRGRGTVRDELSGWYVDPARFDSLRRTPLPDGELVEFDLAWEEGGVPHACRQAHVIALREGQIVKDTVWCGGRWPASLLAEMEEAQRAADRESDVAGT